MLRPRLPGGTPGLFRNSCAGRCLRPGRGGAVVRVIEAAPTGIIPTRASILNSIIMVENSRLFAGHGGTRPRSRARRSVLALAAAYPQICAIPPSTKSSMPVTKLLSSDARNTAALAISSELPNRPIGTAAMRPCLN
jgi:hypothetical protein